MLCRRVGQAENLLWQKVVQGPLRHQRLHRRPLCRLCTPPSGSATASSAWPTSIAGAITLSNFHSNQLRKKVSACWGRPRRGQVVVKPHVIDKNRINMASKSRATTTELGHRFKFSKQSIELDGVKVRVHIRGMRTRPGASRSRHEREPGFYQPVAETVGNPVSHCRQGGGLP